MISSAPGRVRVQAQAGAADEAAAGEAAAAAAGGEAGMEDAGELGMCLPEQARAQQVLLLLLPW